MGQSRPNLKVKRTDAVCIVEFGDRKILEEASINQILEQLSELAASQPNVVLLLNFKNVEHLSSAALGMLITLNRQITGRNGRLMLSDINPRIFEVFRITRLYKLFDIHQTAAEAVASI